MIVKKYKLTPKVKRKLDRLFSAFILNRDNRTCQRCNRSGLKCDTAHLIPRSVMSLRWCPDNAVCLCVSCHKYGKEAFHQNPLSFTQWFYSKYGENRAHDLLFRASEPFEVSEENINRIISKLLLTV